MKLKIFLLSAAIASTSICSAADPKPEDLAGADGRLNRNQFDAYHFAVRDPKLSEVDKDGNSVIDSSERSQFTDQDWRIANPTGQLTISVDAARNSVTPATPKPWGPDWLRLRKDHDSLLKKLGDADPASIGYFRNNLDDKNTWAIEGALGIVLPLVDRKSIPQFGNYNIEEMDFIASGTLNRVSGTGDGSLEVADSLAFRAGLSWSLGGRDSTSWWNNQLISLAYRAEGSTKGGDFKSAGEVDWEPIRFGRPGESVSINGPFHPLFFNHDIKTHLRYTFSTHLEFGEDQEESSFAKLGPKVGLELKPNVEMFPSLTLFSNYTYLWELTDQPDDFDYLEVGGRWALDRAEQIFLEGKYRYGQLPAKYTDIDVFQLSLSVKF